MKLYQYDDIKKFNQALGSFAKNNIRITKTELLVVENKVQYFILADPFEVPVIETETKAKKEIKVKE